MQSTARECDSVAIAAMEHWGKSYKITRELTTDTIDCSTLVSQGHWVGAAVQTPFIAETQRRAPNGKSVELDAILPGDAIFAYPSLDEAPDGAHNHVALYLGADADGRPWVVESRGGKGVLLTPLGDVMVKGGIRRFCINPTRTFPRGEWSRLVREVPKLGRIGARLTAKYRSEQRHGGTDIYVGVGTKVLAPHDGEIVEINRVGGVARVCLWSTDLRALTILAPVALDAGFQSGSNVARGMVLGTVAPGHTVLGCNRIPTKRGQGFIHWEIWTANEIIGPSPMVGLRRPEILRRLAPDLPFETRNAIYALKIGYIKSCLGSLTQ